MYQQGTAFQSGSLLLGARVSDRITRVQRYMCILSRLGWGVGGQEGLCWSLKCLHNTPTDVNRSSANRK